MDWFSNFLNFFFSLQFLHPFTLLSGRFPQYYLSTILLGFKCQLWYFYFLRFLLCPEYFFHYKILFLFDRCGIFSYCSEVILVLFNCLSSVYFYKELFSVVLLFVIAGMYLPLSILLDGPWWSVFKGGLLRTDQKPVWLVIHSFHSRTEILGHFLSSQHLSVFFIW